MLTVAATVLACALALPRQPWVLAAADGYAHYATMPVGLVLQAAPVELTARSLRRARPGLRRSNGRSTLPGPPGGQGLIPGPHGTLTEGDDHASGGCARLTPVTGPAAG